MAPERYPADDHERLIFEAERRDRQLEQLPDDVVSIRVEIEQLREAAQASRAELERLNVDLFQHLKMLQGQRTLSNILLALILAAILYKLF